ncbi:MAG: transcription-repair-coupling factor [Alphaproteobacteria bacterium]|nr:MAG: transcription-repair-coupling factor [Alphaproteobacteria bacterium]
MSSHHLLPEAPGRTLIAGVPGGYDAPVLARLARSRPAGAPVALLHVALDDARMAQLAAGLAFFAPELEVLTFPAWDCLPYDRVSPHRDIVAQRIDTLTRLRAPTEEGRQRLVLTTVAAFLQRVPARASFEGTVLELSTGLAIAQEKLVAFLEGNGYLRAETVGESGEYAVRGGIVDLFPPGVDSPLRVDFFGDEIEQIRSFDPLSQRSTETVDRFAIKPVSELRLDAAAIERFRSGYRGRFGAASSDDPLYEAVSAGRLYPGMEHWLPLFEERLETLLDYVPGAFVTLDHQAEEARDVRLETIDDFHRARADLQRAEEAGGAPYRPLPPDALYLTASDWDDLLDGRRVGVFSPFVLPDGMLNAIDAGGRPGRDFGDVRAQPDVSLYDAVREHADTLRRTGHRVILAFYSPGSLDRLTSVLRDHGLQPMATVGSFGEAEALPRDSVAAVVLGLDRGFVARGLAVIGEQDILGDRLARPAKAKRKPEQLLAELANYAEGDYVVHADHGIGRYDGLETLTVDGAAHDCLRLIYDGGDKLFVPVENIDVVSRYGSADTLAQLDRLGGAAWQARKARVKQRIREIAAQLIATAAKRMIRPGESMIPPEGLYDEFCARFPYAETDDQLRAIEDVMSDLASGKPMDRLVCGDVGFGKTEVALRAAFVAAMSGHQVAVVTPTTLLCRQHFRTFTERFQGLPVRIAQLSRLVTGKAAAEVKQGLKDGRIDIVIGTHALLSKSIEFQNLGLMIVDEEQHFGVAQKERLKELRAAVHVLTLTATPIPRTLQLALSGVREMSLIATPPVDRLAVRTFILPYDPVIVREAIMREHFRGGQIFYVCPRIEDLDKVAERVRKLVPEIKAVVAHGRMSATQLEKAMTAFYDRQYDLLLSTNIVESGIDIPTANTMIIHRAEMFGLAQLYQLRGRIGRSKLRGYAYLTLPPNRVLSETAQKRLDVMQTLDTLGAGFTLASHDLDIRGAGNLLGEEQSGHVREVGIELYQHMLEEAVNEARGAAAAERAAAAAEWTPQINIGTSVLIPEGYVADLGVRLGLYRRIAGLVDAAEIEAFAAEMVDRFGPLPVEVENLLQIIAIKRLCREAGVEKVDAGPKGAVFAFHQNRFARPEKLVEFINRKRDAITLKPDQRVVYRDDWTTPKARIVGVRKLMEQIARLAA